MDKTENTSHPYAGFFINRETEFTYDKNLIKISHSHALFSSHEVDSGSKLLLKSLSKQIEKTPPSTVLDAGCGTGVLGIAIKKKVPEADIHLYDRDKLAVSFTELNLAKNGITDFRTEQSLLMFPFTDKRFDLIVSNLPAKAGKEVLSDFIKEAPFYLTGGGIVAAVIVKPLSSFAEDTVTEAGFEILHMEKTSGYSVFHFRCRDSKQIEQHRKKTDQELFESYIRSRGLRFRIGKVDYQIDTATGLPDFDNLGFDTKLAGELIFSIREKLNNDRKILIINPGQGHIPLFCGSMLKNNGIKLYSASNDLLQIKITEHNIASLETAPETVFINSPSVFDTLDRLESSSFDMIILFYESVPGFKGHELLMQKMNMVLKTGGKLIMTLSASEASRFLFYRKGFVNVKGKRNKGTRSVYLKKSADSN